MLLGVSWLWWLLGGGGIVGFCLLAWLAPALLAEIVKAALGFFITTRIGNIIAAAIIAFAVGDINRSIRDQHEFARRTAQFEQMQQARDAEIAHETRLDVLREVQDENAIDTKIANEVLEFHNAATANTATCRVGPDACRLRHILGETECKSAGYQGVPAPRNAPQGASHHRRHLLSGLVGRVLGRHRKGTTGQGR